jgi:ribosomal protein S18 acetylase RimI-like enzyme
MERTITERLESLNFQGYDVSLYNPTKHQGMYAFLEELQSKSFKAAVKKTIEKPKSDPLLVVTKDNQVMGFAGPLIISDDFRGVFSGIELVGDVRGLGLGKILFFTLCKTFQQMGAKYMSLFTGRNNAARFIYLNAGFKIAESFALMLYDRTEQNK